MHGAAGVGEKALEVVQRHVGIRAARQETAKWVTQLGQRLGAERRCEMFYVAIAAFDVAQAPGSQQGTSFGRGFQTVL